MVEYLEGTMVELYIVCKGIYVSIDMNLGTGKFGPQGIKTGFTHLNCCLGNTDNTDDALESVLALAHQ